MIIPELLKNETTKYITESECDSKYSTKTDIPLVVHSDKVVGDATKLVPSLSYVVNTFTTQSETNILSNQVSTCGSQLTTLDNKFSNYVLKSDIPTNLVTEFQLGSMTLIEIDDDPSLYKFLERDDVVCITANGSMYIEVHFKTKILSDDTITNRIVLEIRADGVTTPQFPALSIINSAYGVLNSSFSQLTDLTIDVQTFNRQPVLSTHKS